MCGRFGYSLTMEEAIGRFGLRKMPPELPPRYNVPPGTPVPAVLNTANDELQLVRWGLIPHWATEAKTSFNLINAKAETIAEKPMFKGLVRSKRCLILADCFYEWRKIGAKKIPYRILMKDERPFAFAGLWDSWQHEGRELKTCLIVTTAANPLVKPIHDRMPVILSPDKERAWLGEVRPEGVGEFLQPYDAALMKAYEISTAINSPKNDSPAVIQPVPNSFG